MNTIDEKKAEAGYSRIPHTIVDSGLLALMKGSEVKIYAVILRHAQYNSRQAFPSLVCLSKETGLQRDTIQAAIKRLVSFGLIRKHRFHQGRKFKNVFTVLDTPEIIIPYQPEKSASRKSKRDEKTGKYGLKPENPTDPYQPEKSAALYQPENSASKENLKRMKENKTREEVAPSAPIRGNGSVLKRPEPSPVSTDILLRMAKELGKRKTLAYLRSLRPDQPVPEFLLGEGSNDAGQVSQAQDPQPASDPDMQQPKCPDMSGTVRDIQEGHTSEKGEHCQENRGVSNEKEPPARSLGAPDTGEKCALREENRCVA